MVAKILVSACLLGRPVRYNGTAKTTDHPLLQQWQADGRLVVICPEVAAGFPVPRPPAEIANWGDGGAVLAGTAQVVEATGADVTALFVAGARHALALALDNGCKAALLIDGSPSCGSGFLYDGRFEGRTHAGAGVTAALLQAHGIAVFAQNQIELLQAHLETVDRTSPPAHDGARGAMGSDQGCGAAGVTAA